MKKISEIANVTFGVNYSPEKYGDIPVIQMRSINEQGEIDSRYNSAVYREKIDEDELLQDGDLLFAAKGTGNIPYIVREEMLPVLASSVFFVIRVNRDIILSEYLAWYLKTPRVMNWIETVSEGSTVRSISIKEFRKFKVPVPDLDVQKKIMELQELQVEYNKYVEMLSTKTELLNNEISKRLIGENDE
ncbi:MAG: restriction endonuclease subunit S [Balneolaceae bacterium]